MDNEDKQRWSRISFVKHGKHEQALKSLIKAYGEPKKGQPQISVLYTTTAMNVMIEFSSAKSSMKFFQVPKVAPFQAKHQARISRDMVVIKR
jgi:uncharacterized protein (DUF1330 family)